MKNWIIWTVLSLIVGGIMVGVYFLLVEPLFSPMDYQGQVLYYIRVFLVLMALLVFACLRQYNATVANTRFLIKLRESTITLMRENQNLQRKLSSVKDVSQRLSDSIKSLSGIIKNKEK